LTKICAMTEAVINVGPLVPVFGDFPFARYCSRSKACREQLRWRATDGPRTMAWSSCRWVGFYFCIMCGSFVSFPI
jgi:hypothetical protein